ncbi:FHA domain-containing protein [Haliangium sp. UPWRP_2]|uniref:FHA domain-containing protein n=1 Tax=Haliangium sp. UPWRP_2 TaxID=1931276 RepID=UPI000B539444|nr:FHA domain-containing protein [Haliangium sp. UPWRP_2]PSM31487.1 hypothetical protein BVG81_005145 [Haliangium sp. UPWRP_2]
MSPGGPLMTAFVGYYDEQGVWRSVFLAKPHITIGRADTCDIVINDPKISSLHADLYCYNSSWLIADHSSRNGVFVNNARVGQAVLLRHQDKLQIGGHVLHFRFSSDANQPTLMDATGGPVRVAPPAVPTPAVPAAIELSPRQAERAHSAIEQAEKLALQQRISELVAELNAKQGELAGARAEATDWLRQASGLRGELEKLAQAQEANETLVRKLRSELDRAQKSQAGEQSEAAVAKGKLKTLEGELTALREASASERASWRRESTELHESLSALSGSFADLEKQLRQHKAMIAERDYRVLRQSEELEALRASYQAQSAELAESQRKRAEHSAQIRALRDELDRSTSEYEARLASAEREGRRMARQIDKLTEKRAAEHAPRCESSPPAPRLLPAVIVLQRTVPMLRATADRALWASVGQRTLPERAFDELKAQLEQLCAYSKDLEKLTQELAS